MEGFGEKIMIGAIGAIIALYFNYIYDHIKKKKEAERMKDILLSHLNGNINMFLNEYIKNYNEMTSIEYFSTSPIKINDSLSLDVNIDLLNFFSQEQWAFFCKIYKINYNQVNVLNSYLKFVYERNPNALVLESCKEEEKIEREFKETITFLRNLKTEQNLTSSQMQDVQLRLKAKEKLILSISNSYVIKAKNSKIYAKKALEIIEDWNELLKKDLFQ